jgi:hypothetical protein
MGDNGADDPKPCYLCKTEHQLLYSFVIGGKSNAICEKCLREQLAKEKNHGKTII